jgi:hypothetical protein
MRICPAISIPSAVTHDPGERPRRLTHVLRLAGGRVRRAGRLG